MGRVGYARAGVFVRQEGDGCTGWMGGWAWLLIWWWCLKICLFEGWADFGLG